MHRLRNIRSLDYRTVGTSEHSWTSVSCYDVIWSRDCLSEYIYLYWGMVGLGLKKLSVQYTSRPHTRVAIRPSLRCLRYAHFTALVKLKVLGFGILCGFERFNGCLPIYAKIAYQALNLRICCLPVVL